MSASFSRVALATLLCSVASVAQAAPSCIDARLSSASPVLRGDVDVPVQLTLTNTCRSAVRLLGWNLPSDDLDAALFQITRNGQRVAYQGAIVKRAAPAAEDFVSLAPGASLNYSVELSGAYDLSQNGHYQIRFADKGHGIVRGDTLNLWLEGRSAKTGSSARDVLAAAGVQAAAASISYTGACKATQQTDLASAVSAATTYSANAASYLGGTPSATPRYVKWFGAFSTAGWNTAKDHFVKARDAFQTQALTLDCSCKKKTTYAYVYPNQPYKIYVCGAFWTAPMTGTDSKGGTLVHEMMHFTVIAGTDDWAYGQSAAANLALTDPAKALDNSDSHEYFAENSPPLQ